MSVVLLVSEECILGVQDISASATIGVQHEIGSQPCVQKYSLMFVIVCSALAGPANK